MGPPHEPLRYVVFTSRDTPALLIDEDIGGHLVFSLVEKKLALSQEEEC
jgi:hypothetical protein